MLMKERQVLLLITNSDFMIDNKICYAQGGRQPWTLHGQGGNGKLAGCACTGWLVESGVKADRRRHGSVYRDREVVMVVLEIKHEVLAAVVEADLPRWEVAYGRLFNDASEAAKRHDTDMVVGSYNGELMYIFAITPWLEVLPRQAWSLDLHFLKPSLEEKRERYDELARGFFEDYSWGVDG